MTTSSTATGGAEAQPANAKAETSFRIPANGVWQQAFAPFLIQPFLLTRFIFLPSFL